MILSLSNAVTVRPRFLAPRLLAIGLAIACLVTGRASLAQFTNGGCDPSAQSCTPAAAPPAGAAACAPGAAGAPCAATGPAVQGNGPGINVGAGNPINVITGNKYQREVDLAALPGVLGLEIVRHYNSVLSSAGSPNGILGRGWKLSYETELYAIGRTLQIVQADGTRIVFNRDARDPSQCSTTDPADGTVTIAPTARGDEYTWRWRNGRQLNFDSLGKLTQIVAPTGEFVSLQHDQAGLLVQVTDPQGRTLRLAYAAPSAAARFRGVQHIDSPLGRFTYTYGSALPAGATVAKEQLLANLVSVTHPAEQTSRPSAADRAPAATSGLSRHYHYEDPRYPTLLTGITVAGVGSDGIAMNQRIATYGYDHNGRANLTVKGTPARLQTGPDGTPLQPAVLVPGTGIEQVTLDFSDGGKTILSNSLGQHTVYHHAIVGGHYRLLDVRGAGCASCGEANLSYRYDRLGRLIATTHLSAAGAPIDTSTTELDAAGRPLRVSHSIYRNGKPGTAQWQVRYVYGASGAAADAPTVIARPSVVPGQEAVTTVRYNDHGQVTDVTERGWTPAPGTGGGATALERSTQYRYRRLNGHSVLAEIDGPLPNGPANSPADSDITRYRYDERGNHLIAVTYPMNRSLTIAYDDAGRANQVIGTDGVLTFTRYNVMGEVIATNRYPAHLREQAAKDAGLWLATSTMQDALGRPTKITRADGQSVHLRYAMNGQLSELADGLGNRVEWKDWQAGNQLGVTTQQWFSADAPTHIARAWYFWHDSRQRLTQRLAPDGGLDQWRYAADSDNGSDSSASPNASGWATHIDPLGRMTAYAHNVNATAQVRMTPQGYIDARINPTTDEVTPDDANADTQQGQDDFGRIVQFTSAQHGTARAYYDAAGQVLRIRHADGRQIDYAYDAAGRVIQKKAHNDAIPMHPTTDTIAYRYSAQGLVQVDDSLQRTGYDYDPLGRPVGKTITLNGHRYTLGTRYDSHGRIRARQLADGNWLVFTANAQTGLPTAITLHHPILSSITATLARWFNAPDLPLLLATRKTVVTGIQATALDGVTHYVHGNGSVTDYRFDPAGRLAGIDHVPPSGQAHGARFNARYHYDAGRRLVAEQINASSTGYRYADWDRLAVPVQATAQAAPPPEQDAAGRTTHDDRYRYQYDVWGTLQRVTTAQADGTVLARYAHNAFGERVKADYADGARQSTRYYLYDHQKRVAELDGNGQIVQQYIYLNDKPIAVMESGAGAPAVIALHTDRRGAPVAASDEHGNVIWTASYGAWGRANVQTVSTQATHDTAFRLDMRLPGQWEDRATHLHYNYQRDYDPASGRYLSPDPLGFPDGPDATLYAGGDPVNKIDPLGLYSTDVHYYLTYFLARVAGLSELQTRTVASAAQFIDDNDFTRPLNVGRGHARRLALYHFTYSDAEIAQEAINFPRANRFMNFNNAQLRGLLGYANNNILCTKAQLFGEYLHAFQDSFAHREPNNAPFTVGGGVGHGMYGEDPDSTFDATHSRFSPQPSFTFNDEKAIAMEQAVLESFHTNFGLSANGKDGFPINFSTIRTTLVEFNGIPLRGDRQAKWGILDTRLRALGLGGIPTYNETWARDARHRNLVDSKGNPLNPTDYPNAILQTE